MNEQPYRLGMIGLGTVGSGVLELLHRRESTLVRRLGRAIEVKKIAVRDTSRSRPYLSGFGEISDLLTDNPDEILEDPEIDLLVEVAGGVDEPRKWILKALENGKDVVTANKAVLAVHGKDIFQTALSQNQRVFYEASVAAAIPIIEMLQNGLIANGITSLSAILNGTCNFILTQMEEEGLDYETALKLAQEKGFAEADPTLDVSGGDAAHKLALLAGIITGSHVPIECIYSEGIQEITSSDFTFARDLGYAIKMVGTLKQHGTGAWEMRVHPTLVPENDLLAQARDEYNAVSLVGDAVGRMSVMGKGAGSLPTASSIVADVLRASRGEREGGNPHGLNVPELVPVGDVELPHYIRLEVKDNPGVLGRITSFFGMHNISIRSINQPEAQMGHTVPVIIITHTCKDKILTDGLEELKKAGLVEQGFTHIRIQE